MTDKESRIRAVAYRLWEEEGRPPGKAEEHWHRARALVDSEPESEDGRAGAQAPAAEHDPAPATDPEPGGDVTAREPPAGKAGRRRTQKAPAQQSGGGDPPQRPRTAKTGRQKLPEGRGPG